jgi:hypothetical protein
VNGDMGSRGLTTNQQRSRQCAEMLRLQRTDAKDLASYLATTSEGSKALLSVATRLDQAAVTSATACAAPEYHRCADSH